MDEEMTPEGQSPPEKNNGKNLTVVVIIVIALVGIYLLAKNRPAGDQVTDRKIPVQAPVVGGEADEKTFNLSAKPFEFSLKEIRVKQGDLVRINLVVEQGMHDWAVEGFGARTKLLKADESDSIVFRADKSGTFEYYCSVANHRQMGMVGKLIVE